MNKNWIKINKKGVVDRILSDVFYCQLKQHKLNDNYLCREIMSTCVEKGTFVQSKTFTVKLLFFLNVP